MYTLIIALLFSLSANFDNVVIGISYGIKRTHIPISKNVIIAVFTTIITFISMYFGRYLTIFLSEYFANILGASSLILIGIIGIYKEIRTIVKEKKDIVDAPKNIRLNYIITYKELFLTIMTLSLNNIAAGIAASAAGINIFYTTFFTFIFSYLFIVIGNKVGKSLLNDTIKKYSGVFSSLVLVLLGILEILINKN